MSHWAAVICCLCAFPLRAAELGSDAPAGDAAFAEMLEYFRYDPKMPLDLEWSMDWPWRSPHVLRRVSYRSVRWQRVTAYFAVPKRKDDKPLPAVILLHGANLFWGKDGDWALPWISILTASGRAVLAPDHFLFGERSPAGGIQEKFFRGNPYTLRDWMTQDVVDVRRAIDFLRSRPEIDGKRIAVMGTSLGGWVGSIVTAVDKRVKAAVLVAPATHVATLQNAPGRLANAANFFPRIPPASLLVVLGRSDSPRLNGRARTLYKLVQGDKKLVEYDGGHFLPPTDYNRDILEWLDGHL